MNKFLSLLKATLSEDMNLFKYKTKANSSKLKKVLFPLMLAIIVMFGMGTYYYMISEEFINLGSTYIMLTFVLIFLTVLILVQGIFKSQGILFEGRDNDLLLSLPIDKKVIISVRLIKMYLFELLFNLLFLLPAYAIYIYYENPGIYFYMISLLEIFLFPIIPTIVASFIGFVIKKISNKFKKKKLIQTILSFGIFFGFYFLSMNSGELLSKFSSNASNINEILLKVYYPIGAYISLINKFDIVVLIKLLLINIIPAILFVVIIKKNYFKMLKIDNVINKGSNKKVVYKQRSILQSLTLKEIKKYFSSTVYVFNTMMGLFLLIFITIVFCTNYGKIQEGFVTSGISFEDIKEFQYLVPKIYYGVLILGLSLVSITSCSISIEGKTFNILKSLPIKIENIFKAKIALACIISLPFILISDLMFIICCKVGIIDILFIIGASVLLPIIFAMIGLIINLKYPKMDATNDTEVVKQSMSSFISIMLGFLFAGSFIGMLLINFFTNLNIDINYIILFEEVLMVVLISIMWNRLKKNGVERFKNIEI